MSAIGPGVPVEVIAGQAEGMRGVVLEKWPRYWEEGVPLWRVRFGSSGREGVLRQDYLRPIGGAT